MERILGYQANEGENAVAVAYPFSLLEENIVVEDVVAGQPIVVFWQPGAVSAVDSSTISESKAVGAAAIYARTLADGTILNFAAAVTTIMDTQTGSTWNIFGRAVSGELEGTQLTHLVGITHFWFAWTAFQPKTLIWQPGILSDNQPSE
jgi:hypothetical protein